MRKSLTIVIIVILSLFFSAGVFLKHRFVVPIIMYHSVNPQVNPYIKKLIVSPRTFQRQMHFLKQYKYNVLSLEEIADMVKNKQRIPARTIAITFDDGYKDFYTYAFPILKKYNFPATMFLIVNEMGRDDRPDWGGIDNRIGWAEVKEMQDSGLVVFGSHALGPEPLINLKSEEQVKKEIFESKNALESRLGRRVTIFSYPEGRFNDKIRQMVIDAGYKAAVTTTPGSAYPNDDIFALKRLKITESAANMFVFAIETSGLYTFMKEYRIRGKNAQK